jgi:hypothetical protein
MLLGVAFFKLTAIELMSNLYITYQEKHRQTSKQASKQRKKDRKKLEI